MKRERFWVYALMLVTVLWGWSFAAIHQALSTISASAFNACRFVLGALVLLIMLALRNKLNIKVDTLRDGIIAGLALFLAFSFQTVGIAYTTASNSSFITGLAVVFTPFLAWILIKLKPSWQQILSAFIAAIGLGFLTMNELSLNRGDLLVLCCALFMALHIIILSKVSKNHDAEVLAFIQVTVVAALSLIWSIGMRQMSVPNNFQAISTLLIMGIAGTSVAYYVQTKAQVASTPSTIALILVLEPLFGGLFGYILGGDRLTMANMFGAGLMIIAMLIAELKLKFPADIKVKRLKD
jgi:drug/metabolite transporter (DMT)-like permease